MTASNYNELMKQYEEHYYVRKNTDGIYVLVNHPAWTILRGQQHGGEEVHVESYDKEAKRLLLTMTKGSVRLFNNRLKSARKLAGEWEKSLTDDGGFLVFDSKDVHKVAEAFGIKKKQKRKPMTEEQKEKLKEQFARAKA